MVEAQRQAGLRLILALIAAEISAVLICVSVAHPIAIVVSDRKDTKCLLRVQFDPSNNNSNVHVVFICLVTRTQTPSHQMKDI